VARAQHADRDLASIGYENFLKHSLERRRRPGEPQILQETWPWVRDLRR
jgi:hypothetical protein